MCKIFPLKIVIPILLATVIATLSTYKWLNKGSIKGDISKLATPIVIFDFDGVICNNSHLILSLLNNLSDKYGYKKVEKDEIDILRGMSPGKILKTLGIPHWKLPFIVCDVRKGMKEHMASLAPFSGMVEVLKSLKENDIGLVLLTTNSLTNIEIFFERNGLENLFDVFCTSISVFGKAKVLKKLERRSGLSFSSGKVYYVGDEVRDVEACKEAGARIISVSWGMSTPESLQQHQPNYLCHSPQELLSTLLQLKE